jgi:signal transduction histidine kinase
VLPDEVRRARRLRAFRVHAAATAAVSLVLVAIWALAPSAPFWPVFPILALGLALGVHGWTVLVEERQELWRGRRLTRPLVLHLGISGAAFLYLAGMWAATTRGYFWPFWPLLALALAAAVHTLVVLAHPSPEAELEERIERLETTRAGAVEVQEDELRRIERDLHDGAQARLVALGMSLGLAEQRMAADPEGARQLVTEARAGVGEALQELRDLVRGIHPPLLTDRGLEAAIPELAERSALPATAKVEVPERPPAAVETAAYFVAAEALANAGKHAGATRVVIDVLLAGGVLDVQVADNGAGGADARGAGLTGLRRRVEALDGTLVVSSPPGGPTIVHARLPCAS